jgi:hypothetical protein
MIHICFHYYEIFKVKKLKSSKVKIFQPRVNSLFTTIIIKHWHILAPESQHVLHNSCLSPAKLPLTKIFHTSIICFPFNIAKIISQSHIHSPSRSWTLHSLFSSALLPLPVSKLLGFITVSQLPSNTHG